MAQSTHTPEVPKYGQPAPIARLFGWFMIAALGAFLIKQRFDCSLRNANGHGVFI